MRHFVFVFVGLILIGAGILVYYKLGLETTTIRINRVVTKSSETRDIVRYSVGGFLALLGGIFLLSGLIGRSRDAKQKKQNLHIMQTGIDTEGTVTFVDKNYSLLVNKVPIYSIVEYNYKDRAGKLHTRRVNTISSEIVIRNQILVGSKIPVKYASEDPAQSVMVIQPV
jgi:hypothetical protein